MRSFTQLRNLAGKFTNNDSTDNLTYLDGQLNDSIRLIAAIRKWKWMELTDTVLTVASQQGYYIPNSLDRILDLYVTVGSTKYMPEKVYDEEAWKWVLAANFGESDAPRFIYKQGNQILISPTPATAGSTITFRGKKSVKDLSIADYATGTSENRIVSVANGGVAVVGSGTLWTDKMAGRFIRITDSDTTNTGDGFWYEIASVGSATTLTLLRPYEGTAIAAGSAAYTIGQMSVIPESYDVAPVYRAAAIYWTHADDKRADRFWRLYDGGYEAGLSNTIGGMLGKMLDDDGDFGSKYIAPFGSQASSLNPNVPPQYPLTGF
jgi:hypothetical protein